MTDRNISQSLEFLKERVSYLEESNQRFVSILEMLASSSEYQGDLSRAKTVTDVFKATVGQLRRLFPFNSMGFYDSQSDGGFELLVADPAGSHGSLDALVETRIMDGTFAWALNRNQAVMVMAEPGETLLLQVVATQSRVRGMFVATLPGSPVTLDAASLNALSIVLYSCAYALEGIILYGMLRDHSLHLEERVRMRTRDLEEARRQAEAASQAKSDFLANMSHEIRTPMHGVMGMTELMLKGGLTPQKEKFFLQAIKDSADSLMLIINDILDFSKIEAGKLTLEKTPFNLLHVVQGCLNLLMVRAEEKGLNTRLHIDSTVPACLVGDHVRLCQVLTNLVGNAIKFSQHGQISVEVGLASTENNGVTLRVLVTDTGIGIPEEACQRIFNQFEQADGSTTRKYGGTGLGLAICKRLVDLMDGNIWVESKLGIGSCFHFTARFQTGEEELLPIDKNATPASGQLRQSSLEVLVVDDVEINRAILQAILEPYGYRVTCAENGRKALEAFQSTRFDIVLLDVQMPEMDGLQATRAIREYEQAMGRSARVPIVAMTAIAGTEDRQLCLDAGMDDYLTKPLKTDQLMQLLNKYCFNQVEPSESTSGETHAASSPEASLNERDKTTPVFARNELLERLGGRPETIPRFVGLFCKGVPPQMEGLETSLAADDADGVRRHAHAIKGSAANISALRMHQVAAMIEKAAKEGDLADAPQRLAMLKEEYRMFVEAAGASKL